MFLPIIRGLNVMLIIPHTKFARPKPTAVFSTPKYSDIITGDKTIWHPVTKPHTSVNEANAA